METNAYTNNSVTELQKTLAAHLTQLADETDNALKSKEMSLYLDFCARFYRYSVNNVWLILLQRPNASHVAGYHAWLKMGRHVMRGEKGIGVLAPLVVKYTDLDGKEDNRLVSKLFTFLMLNKPQANHSQLNRIGYQQVRMMNFGEG